MQERRNKGHVRQIETKREMVGSILTISVITINIIGLISPINTPIM